MPFFSHLQFPLAAGSQLSREPESCHLHRSASWAPEQGGAHSSREQEENDQHVKTLRNTCCICCCPVTVTPSALQPHCQASLSLIISQSLPKFMSIELVMLSNHLILCCPLLLLPSIFPRVFSNELACCITLGKINMCEKSKHSQ